MSRLELERWALDMRYSALAALTCLASCASQPTTVARQCCAKVFSGELTAGLVDMPAATARVLQQQLPLSARDTRFCWYQLPSGHLEAQFVGIGVLAGLDGSEDKAVGYEFERTPSGWVLVKTNEYPVLQE